MDGGTVARNDRTMVDVLSLEEFRLTLDARLTEAQSARTTMVEVLRRTRPALGDMSDATYVEDRYLALYDQHLDRIIRLIHAIEATLDAITTIIDNYQTNEARLVADARDIADALGGVSGVPDGDRANAR